MGIKALSEYFRSYHNLIIYKQYDREIKHYISNFD